MATSFQRYTGDGTTRNFAVPFQYLDRAHVQVSVDGVAQSPQFLTDSMVRLTAPPPTGAIVEVRRKTPTGVVPVDFQDGSVLSEADLDLISRYAAHMAEESQDLAAEAMGPDRLGVWDARTRRIARVAPATAPTDAATKAQVDAGDKAISDRVDAFIGDVSPYLNTLNDELLMNINFPLDLGLVADPFIYNKFDLGAL